MTIASRLDEAMKRAGFKSQSALSRASGIPQPTINRILQGKGRQGPETATLSKLAEACNVTFEWLHKGDDEGLPYPQSVVKKKQEGTPDSLIDPIELQELIGLYCQANAKGRRQIMVSARLAKKAIAFASGHAAEN